MGKWIAGVATLLLVASPVVAVASQSAVSCAPQTCAPESVGLPRLDERGVCVGVAAAVAGSPPSDRSGGSRFKRVDRNRARLLLAPTAWTLEQGDGYYCNREIIMHGVAYGLTDRLSVELGGGVFSTNVKYSAAYGGLKFRLLSSDRFALSVGGLYTEGSMLGRFGVGFAMGSVGTRDMHVTVGLGAGFWNLHDFDFSGAIPLGFAGGTYRFSNSIAIVSEFWSSPLWFEDLRYTPFMVAARFIGDRWSLDAGILTAAALWSAGPFPGFPVVSFAYNF